MITIFNKNYTKLNLGCGPKYENKFPFPWLNVDKISSSADYLCDISKLPEEWSNQFEEVRVSHVLEHFFLSEMPRIIDEWVRVLKSNGILRIIVPDLDIIISGLINGTDAKGRVAFSVTDTTSLFAQIYGIEYDKPNIEDGWRHHFVFNQTLLQKILEQNNNLDDIKIYPKEDDPAGQIGINDDSQNIFSLCIKARKK